MWGVCLFLNLIHVRGVVSGRAAAERRAADRPSRAVMPCWPYWFGVLTQAVAALALRELDANAMRELIMQRDKVVLLMHEPGCPKAEQFAPTLDEVAEAVPGLGYAQVDISHPGFHKWRLGGPQNLGLRAFFRNAPPQYRVLEYVGPPTRESVEAWCRAVYAWDGSGTPPEGFSAGEPLAGGKDEV